MSIEFRVGDVVTAAATNHSVIYQVLEITCKEPRQRIAIGCINDDGSIGPINGDFVASIFDPYYRATEFSKDDVAYYEAVTKGAVDENQVQS